MSNTRHSNANDSMQQSPAERREAARARRRAAEERIAKRQKVRAQQRTKHPRKYESIVEFNDKRDMSPRRDTGTRAGSGKAVGTGSQAATSQTKPQHPIQHGQHSRYVSEHQHVGSTVPMAGAMRNAMRNSDRTHHFMPPESELPYQPTAYDEHNQITLPPGVHFSPDWDRGLILQETRAWCKKHHVTLDERTANMPQRDLYHNFLHVVSYQGHMYHGWHYQYYGEAKLMALDEDALKKWFGLGM